MLCVNRNTKTGKNWIRRLVQCFPRAEREPGSENKNFLPQVAGVVRRAVADAIVLLGVEHEIFWIRFAGSNKTLHAFGLG